MHRGPYSESVESTRRLWGKHPDAEINLFLRGEDVDFDDTEHRLLKQAKLSYMEWRPKSSQKSRISSPSSQVEADDLSESVTLVNILDDERVIIPKHLKVLEAEQTHLTFGSFGDGFDSNGKSVTFLTCENQDWSSENPAMRDMVNKQLETATFPATEIDENAPLSLSSTSEKQTKVGSFGYVQIIRFG